MIKAVGTFIAGEEHTFRTEAYLKWGESEEPLGTILMLNPGASVLKEKEIQKDIKTTGEISIDPTMKTLIEIVEELYKDKDEIQGKLMIYNIFPIRNANSQEAIKQFELLWNKGNDLIRNFPKDREVLLEELKKSPWILIGWGCLNNTETLELMKIRWLTLITESKIPILAKRGKDKLSYYHPKPMLKSNRVEYRKEIRRQFELIN